MKRQTAGHPAFSTTLSAVLSVCLLLPATTAWAVDDPDPPEVARAGCDGPNFNSHRCRSRKRRPVETAPLGPLEDWPPHKARLQTAYSLLSGVRIETYVSGDLAANLVDFGPILLGGGYNFDLNEFVAMGFELGVGHLTSVSVDVGDTEIFSSGGGFGGYVAGNLYLRAAERGFLGRSPLRVQGMWRGSSVSDNESGEEVFFDEEQSLELVEWSFRWELKPNAWFSFWPEYRTVKGTIPVLDEVDITTVGAGVTLSLGSDDTYVALEAWMAQGYEKRSGKVDIDSKMVGFSLAMHIR